MAVYIIAVKRERRAEIDTDWLETVRCAPGVELKGEGTSPDARRVTVRATDDGLAELRARVGAFCHIEPLIVHEPRTDSGPDAFDASPTSVDRNDP